VNPDPWWKAVEEQLDHDRDEALPDPWCDHAAAVTDLSEEQQAFLAALADQPPVPRLSDTGERADG
jgi:hypothetical protein